ncbi:UvrD-helicase domain-containing protein [Croceiramulus getboli]|nr:UvrD-helicase domain-containing protein [Flavobacteriaceae bacterium YJPT1-3]
MPKHHAFTIFNASAGTGKTFALVREYLALLFLSEDPYHFKSILAITFTNKAVGEMKERIIKSLHAFSQESIFETNNPLFDSIQERTGLSAETIHQQAQRILKTLLHNYAAFDVLTIDAFTQRIVRTFARDLGLPQHFEVELKSGQILEKAIDQLLEQIGQEEELTNILIDFALQKTDDDKSWNITYDLINIGGLLQNENDYLRVEQLKNKSLSEFLTLKSTVQKSINKQRANIQKESQALLNLMDQKGIPRKHFTRQTFPNNLQNLTQGTFELNLQAAWVRNLGEAPFYNKSLAEADKAQIDQIAPELVTRFNAIIATLKKLWLQEQLLRHLTPLAVLKAIAKQLETLKNEESILFVSDFYKHIFEVIADEPVPFIYERLGERYKHYFVDEFQDTSKLQWHNLIPLIDHALATGNSGGMDHSLFLVGDPKQAIYRFRGGDVSQFMELASGISPFSNPDFKLSALETNYRSGSAIVQFNNRFFSFVAGQMINPNYATQYLKDSQQQHGIGKEGYVSLSWIEEHEEQSLDERYGQAVLQRIQEVLKQGYQPKDLCILIRRNKQATIMAEYLQQQGIPVVSAESLLLRNSPEVVFILDLLQLFDRPDTAAYTFAVAHYLANTLLKYTGAEYHTFMNRAVHLSTDKFFHQLEDLGFSCQGQIFESLPFYEGVEYLIRSFRLNQHGDGYLQFLLEEIHDFSKQSKGNSRDFLEYWKENEDKLSIPNLENKEAVQLLTIHKSKGLEFPVVIYPYVNDKLLTESNGHHWYAPEEEELSHFDHLLISHSSQMAELNEQTAELYRERIEQLQLDNLNVLYVGLTRAAEQLHIITEINTSKNDPSKTNAELLGQFAEQEGKEPQAGLTISWGDPRPFSKNEVEATPVIPIPQISTSREAHELQIVLKARLLWDGARMAAVERGNVMHELMALIRGREDIPFALDEAESSGLIRSSDRERFRESVTELVQHPVLNEAFRSDSTIYNERPILDASGQLQIPDRVEVLASGETILIDYKTGIPREEHQWQIDNYGSILQQMGLKVSKKYLIYINEGVEVRSLA